MNIYGSLVRNAGKCSSSVSSVRGNQIEIVGRSGRIFHAFTLGPHSNFFYNVIPVCHDHQTVKGSIWIQSDSIKNSDFPTEIYVPFTENLFQCS